MTPDDMRFLTDFWVSQAEHGGDNRWTGLSARALVTIAYGGKDDTLPADSGDLASCYRCFMRMPEHRRTRPEVVAQLARGERYVNRHDVNGAQRAARAAGYRA